MIVKLCGWAGCDRLVIDDPYYCPLHRALANAHKKETAFQNATRYGDYQSHEWRKLRYKVLHEHPYCERCGVDTYQSTLHVHHIIPVRDCPERFLDESNLVVLCQSCHAAETQKEIQDHKNAQPS